ncbi:hypothetical protein MPLSOD_40275 [Mesorhizobium sp. SOD10]|nr:hypothetical protein MPLSOD_40275 [Mesorhizobium sp. SOD10]
MEPGRPASGDQMDHFYLEPEVSGGLGDDTVMDTGVHPPPVVARLHYEFDGWLGDVIVTSFPAISSSRTLRQKFSRLAFLEQPSTG